MADSNSDQGARITVNRLVDYLEAQGPRQRVTILQTIKNHMLKKTFAPYYQPARNAIRAYHSGKADAIEREIGRLSRELRELPSQTRDRKIRQRRARLESNMRALTDYANNFGDFEFEYVGRLFRPVQLQGVRVSAEPTLAGTLHSKRTSIEANVIIELSEPEPSLFSKEYTVEMLSRFSARSHAAPARGEQIWHAHSGSTFTLKRESSRRWDDIEEACHEIALRWDTIVP